MQQEFSFPELSAAQYNSWKLTEFAFHQLYQLPGLDPIHHLIYTELIRLANSLQWPDAFGVPTDDTIRRLKLDVRTYRKKRNELIEAGMIVMIKAGTKNHAPVFTLKTEVFAAFVLGKYIMDKAVKKIPVRRTHQNLENAGTPHAPHLRTHNKTKGDKPLLGTDKPTAPAPLKRTPADGENRSEGRYSRYGLPDTLIPTLKSHLHEQEVEADTVGRILSSSESTDVVTSVITNNPEQNLQREDVERAIKVLVSFLKDNPSREADETIKALTLTPEQKARQKEERLTQ